jgi:hypothetical protein
MSPAYTVYTAPCPGSNISNYRGVTFVGPLYIYLIIDVDEPPSKQPHAPKMQLPLYIIG